MSTLKSVGEKLFKTELATHKVDLALADDIKTEIQKYKGLKDNVDKARNKAADAAISYFDNIRVAYQNSQRTVDLISQLEAKAKELGLGDTGFENWKKEAIKKAAEYKKLGSSVEGIAKSL